MQIGVIEIKNKGYSIFVSQKNNYYIDKSFYIDYQISNPKVFASKFGNLTNAAIPTFVEEDSFNSFLRVIKSINNLNTKFIDALKILNVLGQFISNLTYDIPDSFNNAEFDVILRGLFIWNNTVEGHDFWQDVHEKLNFFENHENQLQNKDIDGSRSNGSERDRVCCGRDESESSARHSGYEARARMRKNALGRSKVYISSRCGCVHRG